MSFLDQIKNGLNNLRNTFRGAQPAMPAPAATPTATAVPMPAAAPKHTAARTTPKTKKAKPQPRKLSKEVNDAFYNNPMNGMYAKMKQFFNDALESQNIFSAILAFFSALACLFAPALEGDSKRQAAELVDNVDGMLSGNKPSGATDADKSRSSTQSFTTAYDESRRSSRRNSVASTTMNDNDSVYSLDISKMPIRAPSR